MCYQAKSHFFTKCKTPKILELKNCIAVRVGILSCLWFVNYNIIHNSLSPSLLFPPPSLSLYLSLLLLSFDSFFIYWPSIDGLFYLIQQQLAFFYNKLSVHYYYWISPVHFVMVRVESLLHYACTYFFVFLNTFPLNLVRFEKEDWAGFESRTSWLPCRARYLWTTATPLLSFDSSIFFCSLLMLTVVLEEIVRA